METFEIKNFGKGYIDSINDEMADPSSTQNCLNVTYNEEYGAVSKDVGVRTLGGDSVAYPLSLPVQRIYEGVVDVGGGSGVFEDRKLVIAGGKAHTFCAGDLLIPLHASNFFSSVSTEIPDISHVNNKFFITGGYDYDIGMGLNLKITFCEHPEYNKKIQLIIFHKRYNIRPNLRYYGKHNK